MPSLIHTKSLKARLALGSGVLFTLVLTVAFIFILTSFEQFRKSDFYLRLRERALSTYNLLIEVKEVDSTLLTVIDQNTPNTLVPKQQLFIFRDSVLLYAYGKSEDNRIDRKLLSNLKKEGELTFSNDGYESLALYKVEEGVHYYILSSGYDLYGYRKLSFLKWSMLVVYVCGMLIGWVFIYFFVRRTTRPLDRLQADFGQINYNNLDVRLPTTGQIEEVNKLSYHFNQLLARLEESIRVQKNFVHYASHELRTPLSIMISLTENSLSEPKTQDQYEEVLKLLLEQQKVLTDITNSLLLLSDGKAAHDLNAYPMLRLDELVFRSVDTMQHLFPQARMEIKFEETSSGEEAFQIHGNEPLLVMTFNNLLKNALQFSPDNRATVIMSFNEREKKIQVLNSGKAIPENEVENIFTPFYRGTHTAAIKGHGLGLPLVKQIVQMHGGEVTYAYQASSNVFTVLFK